MKDGKNGAFLSFIWLWTAIPKTSNKTLAPPWPLYCDGKSWDSPWVIAADIHAVPTLYVLSHNLKLRFKAENVGQMDLWLLKNKSDSN